MEKSEAEETLDAASLLSRFRFPLEEDEAKRFEGEGTRKGTSPKAEECRREVAHSKPWYLRLYNCIIVGVCVVLWLVSCLRGRLKMLLATAATAATSVTAPRPVPPHARNEVSTQHP